MNIQNDVIGLMQRENCKSKQMTDFIAWHDTIYLDHTWQCGFLFCSNIKRNFGNKNICMFLSVSMYYRYIVFGTNESIILPSLISKGEKIHHADYGAYRSVRRSH